MGKRKRISGKPFSPELTCMSYRSGRTKTYRIPMFQSLHGLKNETQVTELNLGESSSLQAEYHPNEETESTNTTFPITEHYVRKQHDVHLWKSLRPQLLQSVVNGNKPQTQTCIECSTDSTEIIHCKTCDSYKCKVCTERYHQSKAMHYMEIWKVNKSIHHEIIIIHTPKHSLGLWDKVSIHHSIHPHKIQLETFIQYIGPYNIDFVFSIFFYSCRLIILLDFNVLPLLCLRIFISNPVKQEDYTV
jgi:hypothetical protein